MPSPGQRRQSIPQSQEFGDIHVWQTELHLWLTSLVESPIGQWRCVQIDGHVGSCSCDALKLWRGLTEERLDHNQKGQNGHPSYEQVQLKMISSSFQLAVDMLNNLVMAGAMLCEVDLADMPSGLLDLDISSDPNINKTSSSVQVGMMDIVQDQFQGGHQE